MGTVTEMETDEERAARLEAEQAALDDASDPAGDDGQSLREQVDAAAAELAGSPEAAMDAVMQGTIDGAWEIAIGGKAPTSIKQRFVGGAIVMEPPEGGWKKGSTYKFEVTARYGGETSKDVVDTETQQAIDCNQTLHLNVQGGRLLAVVKEVE